MTTGPQDCNIPSNGETIDATLSAGSVSIFKTSIVTDTETRPVIAATWSSITNPWVTGVQFEYYPDYMSPPLTRTAPQAASALAWQTSDGVAFSGVYQVRQRAVGVRAFGNWSGYTAVTMDDAAPPAAGPPGPPGADGADGTDGTNGADGVDLDPPPDVPADPTGVSAAADFELFTTGVRNATLTFTFDNPGLSGIEYRVRWKRSTETVYQYQTFQTAVTFGSARQVTVDNIPTGVTIDCGVQFVPQGRTDLASNWTDAFSVDTTPSSTIPTPTTADWGISGTTVTSDDSLTSFGQIVLSGAVNSTDLAAISGISVRLRRSGTSTWTSKETHLSRETRFEFDGLLPSTNYDVEIRYIAFDEVGTGLVFSGVTTGALTFPSGGGGGGSGPPDGTVLVTASGTGDDTLTSTFSGTISIALTGASGEYGDVYHTSKGDPTFPADVDPGNPGGGAYCYKEVVVSPGDVFSFHSGVIGVSGDSTCTGPGGLSMAADAGGDSSAGPFGSADGAGGAASGGTTNTAGSSGGGDGSTAGAVVITKIA